MSNPARSICLWLLVAFVVGVVLALVMVPVIARTASIAAPASLFGWLKGHGLLTLGLFSWSVVVVYGLSIALPVTVALVILFRASQRHRAALSVCLGFGVVFSAYALVPLYSGQAIISPFVFPWWQQGLVASLLLAFGIALGASHVFRITSRPSGRTPRAA